MQEEEGGEGSQTQITIPTSSKESAQREEEEEEKKAPLTEDQEAIRAYLVDDEPLALPLLEKIVRPWWHKEPFKLVANILLPKVTKCCVCLMESLNLFELDVGQSFP